MTSIVSFINMKGGVGKTTSSVTLAETWAAKFDERVLVLDLDAQASASYALCGAKGFEKAVDEERTLAAFFDNVASGRRPEPLEEFVTPAIIGEGAPIDVICSEPSLRFAERALIEHYHGLRQRKGILTRNGPEGQTRRIVREALDRVRKRYGLIVIDCPPGISIFAEAGVACSDLIVIPTIPDYLSTLGLNELNKRFLKQLKRDGNLSGRMAILPTKVRAGDQTHKRFLKDLEKMVRGREIEAEFLYTMVAQDAAIARALEPDHLGEPFSRKYAKTADELEELAKEIRGLISHDDHRPGAGPRSRAA